MLFFPSRKKKKKVALPPTAEKRTAGRADKRRAYPPEGQRRPRKSRFSGMLIRRTLSGSFNQQEIPLRRDQLLLEIWYHQSQAALTSYCARPFPLLSFQASKDAEECGIGLPKQFLFNFRFLTFFLALAWTVLYERSLRLRDRTRLGNRFLTSGITGPKPGAWLLQSHVLLSI